MNIIQIKRKTKQEKYYSKSMGILNSKVIYIKKYAFGLPIKTLHKYRETYYGKVKQCSECNLYA